MISKHSLSSRTYINKFIEANYHDYDGWHERLKKILKDQSKAKLIRHRFIKCGQTDNLPLTGIQITLR